MDKEEVKDNVGDELLDFFGDGKDKGEVEEKPAETKIETKEKVETKPEEKPAEKVPPVKTEKVVEKEPEDDLSGMSDAELRSLVRGLRTRVDDVHGKLVSAGVQIKPDQKVETEVDRKTEKEIEKKVEAEVINFMKDFNMDELIDNPESLNKLLVVVYNKAIQDAETRTVEKVLRSIPQLVVNYASRHVSMSELVREFYDKNQDLTSVKRTVATVANEVASENPDWDVSKVFEEAATRTRRLLGIQKRDRVNPSEKGKDPAFVSKQARARRGQIDTSQMNDLQKEIAETLT